MKPKNYDTGESDYEKVQKSDKLNTEQFMEVLKTIRPEIWVLADIIDQTGINPFILWKVAYHLNNIAIGNKYGQVNVHVEKGVVTFIRGEESDRINMELIAKDKE